MCRATTARGQPWVIHRYSWSLRERNWQAPSPFTTRSVRQYSRSRRSSSALPVGSAAAGAAESAAAVASVGFTWGTSCGAGDAMRRYKGCVRQCW